MRQVRKIGLFGYGTVGQGLNSLINSQPELGLEVKTVVVRDVYKQRKVAHPRLTNRIEDVVEDNEVDVWVEATDDADLAQKLHQKAQELGVPMVTASKKMVAQQLPQLPGGSHLLYEAACGGGMPIIRNLDQSFSTAPARSLRGIINGSCNYILDTMFRERVSFSQALQKAQLAGFAERDPRLDLSGADNRSKLAILLLHAFGAVIEPEDIPCSGITHVRAEDIELAASYDAVIRYPVWAHCDKGVLQAASFPEWVPYGDELALISHESNAVCLEDFCGERHLFSGKGAGGRPTGSALLSDIMALRQEYRYGYRNALSSANAKTLQHSTHTWLVRAPHFLLKLFTRRFDHLASLSGNRVVVRARPDELMAVIDDESADVLVVRLPESMRCW